VIADKIALIGANGNMGKRYQAIMNWCEIPYKSFDVHNMSALYDSVHDVESFIVATPTDTHFDILMDLKKYQLPILCEKAVTKNLDELYQLLNTDIKLTMVNQYKYLVGDRNLSDESYYHYFKSGDDKIFWDCINIIGLSNKFPELSNESPIWNCCINGVTLNLGEMDYAYIQMIKDWKDNPKADHDYIVKAHEKTYLMMTSK
jgi:hypothetical protein